MAASNLFIVVVVLIYMVSLNTYRSAAAAATSATPPPLPKFPAIIVFGDSTVDAGNNNYIKTLAKADMPPYGENFPGHVPTGRFSDGKLVTDIIASMLRIKDEVPPFLKPNLSENELQTGVCFASAATGYDDLVTKLFNVIPLSEQVEMFKSYIDKLKGIVGEDKAKNIIGEALVIISTGSNDFLFNFLNIPIRRLEFDSVGYQRFLLQKLEDFLQKLYELGCRKMVIAGLPPIGCLPVQMTIKFELQTNRECLEDQNDDAQSYNNNLAQLLPQLQAKLPMSKIVYADIYEPLLDMINHPQQYGFVETKRGCCGSGLVEVSFMCNPSSPVCSNSSQFLFWDSVHPTQQAYIYLADYMVNSVLPQLLHV
ncbi:GDSL esterase/lipase [Hibiscus syriacus]|uniref:GDSL esterase/lipase n=1 Tax=Hibiscus syriacus TaxID=106335 RepID=A0A6A2X010_HIBSY|nr:GDSL esterase/lipase At1g06990-like [Hibiscus syriacus]KAE8655236.1 GDSL esterase/lipase [Hibiscus syriacus]